jgi:hypothetical protein
MRRIHGLILSLCVVSGGVVMFSAAAQARTFEDLLKKAQPVEEMEPVLSPFLQVCGDSGKVEDLQCRAIRSRMQRKVRDQLYVYTAPSVDVGAYNGTKLNYPVKVVGELTKGNPVELKWGLYGGTNKWHITTEVPKSAKKKGKRLLLEGLELEQHLGRKQKFLIIPVGPSKTERWEKTTKQNLRVQFLFSFKGAKWPDKMKGNGVVVELKGYRLYNQCNGKVLASIPPSKSAAPVVQAPSCRGPVSKVVARASKTREIPQTISASVIRQVMRLANPAIKECFETYQIKGLARVRVTLQSDGTVMGAKVLGKFSNTPTGKCILDKVQNLIFPRFKKAKMNFTYPFYLR